MRDHLQAIAARRISEDRDITPAAAVELLKSDPAVLRELVGELQTKGSSLGDQFAELLAELHPPRPEIVDAD